MTDRELLEMAAKAIGLTLRYNYLGDQDARQPWIPLADDGDALRLVVECKMTIAFEPNRGGWSVGAIVNGEFRWLAWDEDCNRAIVHAAAEIGKNTK